MGTQTKLGEPCELAGSRLIFTTYDYIRPPQFGWYNDAGENITVKGKAGLYDAHMRVMDAPAGIRIVAQTARHPDEPYVVEPEHPWEADGLHLGKTFIFDKDDGYYKVWGTATSNGKALPCYLQSRDFETWERPDLGLVEFDGSRKNNLIEIDGMLGNVFKDPSSRDEPWKWIAESSITRAEYNAFREKYPDRWDAKVDRVDAVTPTHVGESNIIFAVKGGISPDGFSWKTLPEPLVVEHSDTQIRAYYDTRRNRYVGYFRDWRVPERSPRGGDDRGLSWLSGRRSISRAETEDFRKWPMSEIIADPGPDIVNPSEILYTNCHTFVPGAPDQHLFFPSVWSQANDATWVGIASSSDGKVLHWLPGGPILDTAPFGKWDGGCVFPRSELLEFPDGRWVLGYSGVNVPHKYPRKGAIREGLGLATWEKGRMIAVEARDLGQFTTTAIMPPGRKILINALTMRGAGSIRVEVATAPDFSQRVTVPGRSFEDCIPINGDAYRTTVKWKDGDDIGVVDGTPISLRFKLEQAQLFFVDFE